MDKESKEMLNSLGASDVLRAVMAVMVKKGITSYEELVDAALDSQPETLRKMANARQAQKDELES